MYGTDVQPLLSISSAQLTDCITVRIDYDVYVYAPNDERQVRHLKFLELVIHKGSDSKPFLAILH